jgi:hypothetical protein
MKLTSTKIFVALLLVSTSCIGPKISYATSSACPKVGVKKTINGKKMVCESVRGKRVWVAVQTTQNSTTIPQVPNPTSIPQVPNPTSIPQVPNPTTTVPAAVIPVATTTTIRVIATSPSTTQVCNPSSSLVTSLNSAAGSWRNSGNKSTTTSLLQYNGTPGEQMANWASIFDKNHGNYAKALAGINACKSVSYLFDNWTVILNKANVSRNLRLSDSSSFVVVQ